MSGFSCAKTKTPADAMVMLDFDKTKQCRVTRSKEVYGFTHMFHGCSKNMRMEEVQRA